MVGDTTSENADKPGHGPPKRRWICEGNREEEDERHIDLIHSESHFNFIMIHVLRYFSDHICLFGKKPMYSTELGEHVHKEQIKDGWQRSNKNNAARQLVDSYQCQHSIRLRLLNLVSVLHHGGVLSTDVLQHLDRMSAVTTPVVLSRILKGRRDDMSNILDFAKVSRVSLESIYHELIQYTCHNLPTEHWLLEHHVILQTLPVELLTQLKNLVLAFQECDIYEFNSVRCTGAVHFRNQGIRNDWVGVRAGTEEMYGALRGRLPAKLVMLFKIRVYTCENTVCWVMAVRMLSAVNSGFQCNIHGLVTVQMREDAREFTIVDIGTIHSLAHHIHKGE